MIKLHYILREANGIESYYKNTHGVWKGLDKKFINDIMYEYIKWRRKRNKPETIEVNSKQYIVDYESENKNAYWRSRSKSYYFIEKGSGNIIRISDHWSKTGPENSRSKKLNCGRIGSCYWELDGGDKLDFPLPGEKYSSILMGGIIHPNDLQPLNYTEQ